MLKMHEYDKDSYTHAMNVLEAALLYKTAPATDDVISIELTPKLAALITLAIDNLCVDPMFRTEEILIDRQALYFQMLNAVREQKGFGLDGD